MTKPVTIWYMLEGFVGQEDRLRALEAAINSGKRGNKFPHSLLLGRAGTGKTTLAKMIGKELDVPVVLVHASSVDDKNNFTQRILDADGGILFIDEIHSLDKKMAENLYTVIDSGTLVYNAEVPVVGTVSRAVFSEEQLPEGMTWHGVDNYWVPEQIGYQTVQSHREVSVSVIGATTDEALLSPPLLSRLSGLKVHLRTYTREELVDTIRVRTLELCVSIDDEAAEYLAKRTRGNPRRIRQLIDRVCDHSDDDHLSIEDAETAITNLGVDDYGLEESHREMLKILAAGSVSRTNLGYKLGIPPRNVDHYFGELMELGLAQIGRKHEITSMGQVFLDDMERT